jgi:hypothetical protein
MKVPSGGIHVLCGLGVVKGEELKFETIRVLGLNSCLGFRLEKIFDALMPEGLDHAVYRISSVYGSQEATESGASRGGRFKMAKNEFSAARLSADTLGTLPHFQSRSFLV